MLKELAEYAYSHGAPPPGFKPKDVQWAITFYTGKGFTGIVPLGNTGQKKQKGLAFLVCPEMDRSLMQGSIRSHFLVETAAVVALLEVTGSDTKTYFIFS